MWSSHATKRPVAYKNLHARRPRRAALIHTNGGGTDKGSLYGYWSGVANSGQHLGAHFQVMSDGRAEQYVDTAQVIYHAYSASEWAVGIETQDDGHPSTPWTQQQLATIIAILHDLGVPGTVLKDAEGDGLGWHELYPDWNKSGHTCPGSVREQQIRDVILPALNLSVPWWWHRPIRTGDSGPDVFAAKRRLSRLGYKGLSWSSSFGPALDRAVRNFQGKKGLRVTGVIDRATAHAIRIA